MSSPQKACLWSVANVTATARMVRRGSRYILARRKGLVQNTFWDSHFSAAPRMPRKQIKVHMSRTFSMEWKLDVQYLASLESVCCVPLQTPHHRTSRTPPDASRGGSSSWAPRHGPLASSPCQDSAPEHQSVALHCQALRTCVDAGLSSFLSILVINDDGRIKWQRSDTDTTMDHQRRIRLSRRNIGTKKEHMHDDIQMELNNNELII